MADKMISAGRRREAKKPDRSFALENLASRQDFTLYHGCPIMSNRFPVG
jgi:hypothetical protein